MNKTVLITGCSSGIGLSTAKVFLSQNWTVIATVRTISAAQTLKEYAQQINKTDTLNMYELDVTSEKSIQSCLKKIAQKFSSLDVLVNNAGFGYHGAVMDMTTEEIKDQFETNLFGLHNLTQSLLPLLKKSKGMIINISSISGHITFPLSGAYSASKHALKAYTEALYMELSPDIAVYAIEPGAIQTSFYTKGAKHPKQNIYTREYKERLNKLNTREDQRTTIRSEPFAVAQKIIWIAQNRPYTFRHKVGKFSTLVPFLHHILPVELFYFLLQKVM